MDKPKFGPLNNYRLPLKSMITSMSSIFYCIIIMDSTADLAVDPFINVQIKDFDLHGQLISRSIFYVIHVLSIQSFNVIPVLTTGSLLRQYSIKVQTINTAQRTAPVLITIP